MGKPLTIQEDDDRRIEALKGRLGAPSKIAVVRAGLDLLEQESDRRARIERWRAAAHAAAPTSRDVNAEFRRHTRLKKA
jgi:hypothetical protein